MSREGLSELNVFAVYPTRAEARRAVEALERAGVEGGDVSLFGPMMLDSSKTTGTYHDEQELREAGFLAGAAAELAFSSVASGEAVVGVHTDSEAELDTASRTLQDHDPRAIAWFDHRGRKLQYAHTRRR